MVMPTSSWRSLPTDTHQDPVYERPLGLTELGFYWDSVFERTADTLQHADVEIESSKFEEVTSLSNLTKIWTKLKQQFPLLGARLDERGDGSVFFVVTADNLKNCRPAEVSIRNISSVQEALDIVDTIITGRKHDLSNNLLARLVVLRRMDQKNHIHMLLHVAHCITDGMANITILTTVLNHLCGTVNTSAWDLNDRLALSTASEELGQRKFNLARRRWRIAIASVISARRASRLTGGHTLPRKVSQITPYTPARSRWITSSFSAEESTTIFLSCRKHKLTFGNVFPVIGQIALTRVLLRRYLCGDISDEEWEFRKREPMSSAGPLNLRPFLDKDWVEAGGLANVCISIGFFVFSLPYMPLGSASSMRPGMLLPSYGELLSPQRFILRSKAIRDQSVRYMKHPLFLELAALKGRVARLGEVAQQWRKFKGPPAHFNDKSLTPAEQASAGLVISNGGSSMGNVDLLLPREYPVGSKQPTISLKTSATMLRCRPAELYLGAATSRQQLHTSIFWDENVFDEGLVRDWLEEVRHAINFYLGWQLQPRL